MNEGMELWSMCINLHNNYKYCHSEAYKGKRNLELDVVFNMYICMHIMQKQAHELSINTAMAQKPYHNRRHAIMSVVQSL